MRSMALTKKVAAGLLSAGIALSASAYRSTTTSTEPNVWSRNYSGVLAAAARTGYPVLIVVVNSATCGHCHILNQLTLNSSAFAQMERELTFYKLMMDAPNGGEFQSVVNRYYSYFNYGMYPIIGVLRKDGSMYGSFGNRVTDGRDVTADVRGLIERLAAEQGADIWSGSGATPGTYTPPKPTLAEWAAKLKGKSPGLLFDANENLVGSVAANFSANGKVSLKMTTRAGNTNVRGAMSLADDVPQVRANGVSLAYDEDAGAWSGSWGDMSIFIRSASAKNFVGLYTAEASSGSRPGYLTVTLNKTGKAKTAGLLGGRNKVSANGNAVVLPQALIAESLPTWRCTTDAVFVPVVKRGAFAGGVAFRPDGTAVGRISAFGADWTVAGAKFALSSLAALNGKSLAIHMPSAPIEVGLVAKGANRIATAANDYKARLTARIRQGTFKGSAKIGKVRISFEGALIAEDGGVRGAGVTYGAGGVHAVSIVERESGE